MLLSLLFILLCILFLVPIAIAVVYLYLGVRTLIAGLKEKSKLKKVSGYNTIFFSVISLLAIFLIWYWLVKVLFSWEM